MESEKIKWDEGQKRTCKVNSNWLYFKLNVALCQTRNFIGFLERSRWKMKYPNKTLHRIQIFESQLFVHAVCLASCLSWSFLPCHSCSSPKDLLSVWHTDFHCLKAVLQSLPGEAGCVMNPIVHLFHGCHRAQRQMTDPSEANETMKFTSPVIVTGPI